MTTGSTVYRVICGQVIPGTVLSVVKGLDGRKVITVGYSYPKTKAVRHIAEDAKDLFKSEDAALASLKCKDSKVVHKISLAGVAF